MSDTSISYIAIFFAIGAVTVAGLAWFAFTKFERRWALILRDSNGGSLETMLDQHAYERADMIKKLASAEHRIAELEQKMETSKRHLALVRYDAFEEVGGSQSFALAIYDDLGDGAIINSLVGRADCRVYGKSLNRGRSERSLSREELLAVEEAAIHEVRPIISS
ncbi:MAG: DUF4446 family protein [Fimbriimonadaceae bacterium]